MFPPATPGSTLNEHPDAGIAYIRVSSCLYKQFIHLSLYLPEVFPRCYAHSRERQQNVPTDFPIAAWPLWRPCRLPSLQRRFHRNFEGSLLAKVPLWRLRQAYSRSTPYSHIIPEVFFLKPLIRLIFFRCLIRPSLCDNIGQKSELYPFFHSTTLPFVRQVLTDLNAF